MSFSPNSSVVQHTIDLKYEDTKRSSSLRWVAVNCVLCLVFAYDLWHKCPGYTSALHYAEGACAGVLLANALLHARRLAAPRRAPPALTPRQRRLLGLPAAAAPAPGPAGAPATPPSGRDASHDSVSLSPRRWRADASPPPSPPSPVSPAAPRLDLAPDEFIADRRSLAEYLRSHELRARAEPAGAAGAALGAGGAAWGAGGYQLAAPAAEGGRAAPDEAGEAREPLVWRRLRLDPQRLTQWNFNLRLWLHVTILERLVRELASWDAGPTVPAALQPYLQPFADQRYVVQRIRELAAGGCLSAYKWNGGGSEWEDSKPTDAELVLHVLGAYLDGQRPAGARGFSAAHVSGAPAPAPPPPRTPRTLAVHRVSARPPHYVLLLGDETLEVARGRNNLLHTLLLLLAAAARADPPALSRLHLGRAGLNMLWIIGR